MNPIPHRCGAESGTVKVKFENVIGEVAKASSVAESEARNADPEVTALFAKGNAQYLAGNITAAIASYTAAENEPRRRNPCSRLR